MSEMEFNLLQALKKDGKKSKAEELEEKKISILDPKSNVPDDVRAILYNDAARRLQKQTMIDLNTPAYVTSNRQDMTPQNLHVNSIPFTNNSPDAGKKEDTVTTSHELSPAVSSTPAKIVNTGDRQKLLKSVKNKRAGEILSLLEASGVTWNDNDEVIIDSKRVPGSNLKGILTSLASGKRLHETPGIQEVSSILKKHEIPFNIINRSTQAILQSQKFTPKLSSFQTVKARRNAKSSPGKRSTYENAKRKLWEKY